MQFYAGTNGFAFYNVHGKQQVFNIVYLGDLCFMLLHKGLWLVCDL